MPELNITHCHIDLERHLLALPLRQLKAVMLWPDNEKRQVESVCADTADEVINNLEPWRDQPEAMVTMPIRVALALGRAPLDQAFGRERAKRFIHGLMTGVTAWHMLTRPGEKIMSVVADAADIINKMLDDVRISRERDGQPTLLSEIRSNARNLETNIWPKFRPVAPLWTAYAWRGHASARRAYLDSLPCSAEELPKFLAEAEYLRALGELRRCGNGVLFEAGKMWGVPPEVELPAPPEELVSVFQAPG